MSDYIKREDVYSAIGNYVNGENSIVAVIAKEISKEVFMIPTADVRPVVRGKWELKTFDDGYGEYQLYECDKCGAVTAQRRNYCPNCGADMRETDGEEAKRIKKQLALNGLGYPYDLPKREES